MIKTNKKHFILILTLIVFIFFILSIKLFNFDKYKGKIKLSSVDINAKILSSIANVESNDYSKGTDEIEYNIKYTLDEVDGIDKRSVLINASLTDKEAEYARFKDISNNKIESTVTNNGKNIEVIVKNVELGQEKELKLKIIITNAPNGYKLNPTIGIKEVTGEITKVTTKEIEVKTNSLEGQVFDEEGMLVHDIELGIYRNNKEIKRTYSNNEGKYVFTDLEEGKYEIKVLEDKYECIENEIDVKDGITFNVHINKVEPFNIETHKYISKIKLIVNGKEYNYSYDDVEKVVQTVKNAKTISGEIEYKITVENKGKKDGIVTKVIDKKGEGLKYNKDKNTGWEELDGILYYRPIEGSTLKQKEKKEVKLILDIENTNEIKTYLNKLNTKGEIEEKVIYIFDGIEYKNEIVYEGEKLDIPENPVDNFSGWYTDKNCTNKYNFDLPVEKDLILYGKTNKNKEYRVNFIDGEEIIHEEIVEENAVVQRIENPSKKGYTFDHWSLTKDENEYDFNTKVTKDINLYAVYYRNMVNVLFYDIDPDGVEEATLIENQLVAEGTTAVEPENIIEHYGYTLKYFETESGEEWDFNTIIEEDLVLRTCYRRNKYNVEYYNNDSLVRKDEYYYKDTIDITNTPVVTKEGHTFLYWGLKNSTSGYDFTLPVTKSIKLYSNFEINKNDVIFNDENRVTTVETDYGSTVSPIDNQGKTGYTFKFWSKDKIHVFDFSTPIKESTTVYAVYQAIEYNIHYELNGGSLETGKTNPTKYTIEDEFTLNNPSLEGYKFTGWSGTDIDELNREVTISVGSTGERNYTANYKINRFRVTFIDNGTQYSTSEVNYREKVTKPENPSKEGYTFKYWSQDNENSFDFNTPITRDITLYSIYEINKYTVTFMDGENKFAEKKVNYNEKVNQLETNPNKEHYIFTGWTLNNEEYDFNTLVTKDIVLYSSYEEVIAPIISHTPTEWTKNDVTVSIQPLENYTYMYKIDNGDYTEYIHEFAVDKNSKIYAYSIKSTVHSVEVTHDVNNIDKIKPIITSFETDSITPTTITVNIKGKDNESGLKKYKIYVNDEEVFTSNEYMINVNEEKNDTYIISNLEEKTTYNIKLELIDKVGNTKEEELDETTPEKHIVARIIGIDNNPLNINDYIKFESLREAIEYNDCVDKQCTIQMVDNTEESNEVLGGQNITLDLNGKTISGVKNYTIYNNGELKIIDSSEIIENSEVQTIGTGKINNSNGVGIHNNRVLQIGELGNELYVSKTSPIIEGSTFGIENDDILNYYDGLLIGGTLGLKGEATETPYLYNASSSPRDSKEVVSLEIVADAEARIKTTYYTEVKDGILESRNGSTNNVSSSTSILSQAVNTGLYYFVYDESTGVLYNNNKSEVGTTASSYIKIDLIGYEKDQILKFDADISPGTYGNYDSSSSRAYSFITNSEEVPSKSTSLGRIINTYSKTQGQYKTYLQKGKVYYLHFIYDSNVSESNIIGSNRENTFKISSLTINDCDSIIDYYELTNDSTYYFTKQEDGTLQNNNVNNNDSHTTAHSYITFDRTNESDPLEISLYVSTVVANGNDIGYITLNKSTSAPAYNTSEGRYVYHNSNTDGYYTITIPAGEVSYLHFGFRRYYHYNSETSTFKIKILNDNNENITSKTDYEIPVPVLNEEPDTIQILRNITLTNPISITETRNVILDLNGHTLTTSKDDYVIKNSGELKIIDTDYTNQLLFNYETYLNELENYNKQVNNYDRYISSLTYVVNHNFTYNYDYTGDVQKFIVPYSGNYQIELWGAQGGTINNNSLGGKGAYTKGEIFLNKGDIIYVYVGENYEGYKDSMSFNGGGSGSYGSSEARNGNGGGATDIRLVSGDWNNFDSLKSRIMVAAGGGGATNYGSGASGGYGGSFIGGSGKNYKYSGGATITQSSGGTQINGGLPAGNNPTSTGSSLEGKFGSGGYSSTYTSNYIYYSGGGGGYYGGGTGGAVSSNVGAAAGGSSFISGYDGCNAISEESTEDNIIHTDLSEHYSHLIFNNSIMLAGNEEIIEPNGASSTGHSGNGYARITIVDEEMREEITRKAELEDVIEIEKPGEEPTLNTNYIQTGNITATTNSVIFNDTNAVLNIQDAIINVNKTGSSSWYYSGIYNNGDLTLGENAIINCNNSYTTGIRNEESGTINPGKGTVNILNSYTIGLQNYSYVNKKIDGLTITSNTNNNNYGIYESALTNVQYENMNVSGPAIGLSTFVSKDLYIKKSNISSSSTYSLLLTGGGGYNEYPHTTGTVTIDNSNISGQITNNTYSDRTLNIINNSYLFIDNGYERYNITSNNNNLKLNIIDSTLEAKRNTQFTNYNAYNISNVGKLYIKDSTLKSDYSCLVNNSSYEVTLDNVEFKTKGLKGINVITNTSGIINVNNGSITNESNSSVAISNAGTININGNFEIGSTFSTGINNSGTITFGKNEGTISTAYPLIQATGNSINNSGTFNYYDGKFVGQIDNDINGVITSYPENTELYVEKGDTLEEITLKTIDDMHNNDIYVCEIGNNKFSTLEEAISSVTNNTETTIKMIKDYETLNNVNINDYHNIKINYNGHYIIAHNNNSFINNDGILTLYDDSNSIKNNTVFSENIIVNNNVVNYNNINYNHKNTSVAVENNGTITLNSGKISSEVSSGQPSSKIINNNGTFIMNNGSIVNTTGSCNGPCSTTGITVSNNENAEFNLYGGSITANTAGSNILNNGTFKMTSGTVTSNAAHHYRNGDTSAYVINNNGDMDVTGGSIITNASNNSTSRTINNTGTGSVKNVSLSHDGYIIVNSSNGDITFDNVTLSGRSCNSGNVIRSADNSKLTIKNSTININDDPVYIDGNTIVTLENNTFTMNVSGWVTGIVGLNVAGNSTLNLKGNIMTVTGGDYAIRTSGTSTLNMESGTFTSSGLTPITATGTSTINFGIKGDKDSNNNLIVSKEEPLIKNNSGKALIASNTSIVNIYDGKFVGNSAIEAVINELEEGGYELIDEIVDGKVNQYLDIKPLVMNMTKENTPTYFDLDTALENASSGDTLKILRGLNTLSDYETHEIESNMTITLDLNGNTLNINNNKFIVNNGNLTITDTSDDKDGNILMTDGIAIENNGTLTLDAGKISSERSSGQPSSKIIDNNGTFIMNDGSIINTTGSCNGPCSTTGITVSNNENAEFNLYGGSITANTAGSNILNNGTFKMTSGTVTSNAAHHYSSGDTSAYVINNIGNMNITGGNIITNASNNSTSRTINNTGTGIIKNVSLSHDGYIIYNSSNGDITFDNVTMSGTGINSANVIYGGNDSKLTIKNSTINVSADPVIINGNAEFTLENTEFTMNVSGWTTGTVGANISGNSTVNLKNSTINVSGGDYAFRLSGTSTLNMESGTFTASGLTPITATGTTTINFGIKGDKDSNNNLIVSKEEPLIKNNSGKALIASNTSIVNIYDGKFVGNSAIEAVINELETNYDFVTDIIDDKVYQYLDLLPLVMNMTKENTPTYFDIDTALENASSGDTLKILRGLNTLSDYETHEIESNMTITLDLNGKILAINNNKFIVNNGNLTITDTSDDKDGNILMNTGIAIENNGTLTLDAGKISSEKTSGQISSKIIDNNGTFIMNNGSIVNTTGSCNSPCSINGMTVSNNENAEFYLNSGSIEANTAGPNINNNGTFEMTDGSIRNDAAHHYSSGDTAAIVINNNGDMNITGGSIITNASNNSRSKTINNTGTGIIKNVSLSHDGYIIYNSSNGDITFDNVTMSGTGINSANVIYGGNDSKLTIKNSTINVSADPVIINGNAEFTLENTEFTMNVSGWVTGTVGISVTENSTLNLKGNTMTVTGGDYAIRTNGTSTLNIESGTYNSSPEFISVSGTSRLNISGGHLEGSSYIVDSISNSTINIMGGELISTSTAINNTSTGTINIGTKGGVPSNISPYIKGTYGLYSSNNNSSINFYDGIIIGNTLQSISGAINEVEPGYKIVTEDDSQTSTTASTLELIGSTESVASVGTLNFANIQSAINYAVLSNQANIVLHKNITLESDLTKPDGIEVNIYLNNFNLNLDNYNVASGINIKNETYSDVSGSISKILSNIFGINGISKNIVIYQMEDGSKLSNIVDYTLYKKENGDYNEISFDEENIGRYTVGKETIIIRTVRNKIYLSNLSEGDYKLVGSDNKELEFNIYQNNISNNIREDLSDRVKIESISIATLILQLNTGIIRPSLITLAILFMIVIILSIFVVRKNKRMSKN